MSISGLPPGASMLGMDVTYASEIALILFCGRLAETELVPQENASCGLDRLCETSRAKIWLTIDEQTDACEHSALLELTKGYTKAY